MKKKGETPNVMNEFSELWISGNDKAGSLYVSPDDRRVLIYEANPVLKDKKQFWIDLYSEFNNLEVAKAWFDFLKHRDVSHFHPDNVHVASVNLKKDSILDSMSKAHIFTEQFFSTSNWHVKFFEKMKQTPQEWFANIAVSKRDRPIERRGQVMIRITQEWVYENYKLWMKTCYPSSKILNMNTFLCKLEEVGLCVQKKKQRVHKTTKRVVDFFFEDFKKGYTAKYNTGVTVWTTEDEESLKFLSDDIAKYT